MTPRRARLFRATLLVLLAASTARGAWVALRLWEHDVPLSFSAARPYLTVAASLLVAVGSLAALRNRTWGLLVLTAASGSVAASSRASFIPCTSASTSACSVRWLPWRRGFATGSAERSLSQPRDLGAGKRDGS